jgi:hypothetical protein
MQCIYPLLHMLQIFTLQGFGNSAVRSLMQRMQLDASRYKREFMG